MKKLQFKSEMFDGAWSNSKALTYQEVAEIAQARFDVWYAENIFHLLKELEDRKENPADYLPYGFDW